MIDSDLIRSRYDRDHFNAVADALQILHREGLFTFIISVNKQLLVDGFDLFTVDELAAKIHENQQTNRVLLSLDELAGSIQKER